MFKKLNHNGNNFEFPDNEKGKKDYEAFIAKFPDAIEVAIAPDPDKEGKETPSQEIESAPVEESVALEPTVTESVSEDTSLDLQKTSVRKKTRQKDIEKPEVLPYSEAIKLDPADKEFLKNKIDFIYNETFVDPETKKTLLTEDYLYAEELEKARQMLIDPKKYNINTEPIKNPSDEQIKNLAEKIVKDKFKYNKIKEKVTGYLENIPTEEKDKITKEKVEEFTSLDSKYKTLNDDYVNIAETYATSADFKNLQNISKAFEDNEYKFDLKGLKSVKEAEIYLDRIQKLGKPENFVTQATADLYNNLVNKYKDTIEQAETIVLDNGKEVPKATFNLYKDLVEDNQNVNDSLNAIVGELEAIPEKLTDLETELSFLKKNYSTASRLGANVAFQLGKVPLSFVGGVSRILNDSADLILEGITGEKQPKNKTALFNYTSDLIQKKEAQMQEEFSDPIKFEDAFKNGSNFTEFFLQELASQAGVIAMMSTGLGPGATMLSASTYEDKRAALEEEEELLGTSDSIGKKIGISAGFAAAEVMLGFAPTMKIFNRGFKAIENVGKRELIEMGVKKFIQKQLPVTLLKDPAREAITEGGTVVAQNWIDRTFGGKKDTVGLWDNVPQAVVSGGLLGTAFSSVPFVQGVVLANLSDYNSYEGYRKNLNQIQKLNTSLQNLDGRSKAARAIKSQIVQLEKDNFNIINQVEQNVDSNLTGDGFQLFANATKAQEELRLKAKAVEENLSLTKEEKEASLSSFKKEFDRYQRSRDAFRQSFKINIDLLPQAERNKYVNKAKLQLESEGKTDVTQPEINKRAEKIWQIETFEKNLESDIKTNKSLKEAGVDQTYEVAETKAEAIALFTQAMQKRAADPNNNLTESEAEKLIKQFSKDVNNGTANGANVPSKNTKTGKDVFDIIIVKENAINNGKTSTGIHEIGHTIFTSGYSANSESFAPLANAVLAWLEKNNTNAYLRIKTRAGNNTDEILTEFLEEVASGRLDLEAKNNKGLLQYLPLGIMNAMNKSTDGKSKFKLGPGTDTVQFLKSLGKKLKEGTLTLRDVQEIQEGKITEASVETVIKESKSLTPEVTTDAENRIAELQKLKEETTATAAKFGKEYIPSAKEQRLQKELLNIIDPVISKVAENRTKALYDKIAAEQKENVSREDYRESLKSNLATMAVNEFTQGKQDLETFIVNRGYLRANSLAKELGIESTEEFGGPGITSDITESVQVAAETAPEVEIEVAETKPTERLIEVKKQVLSESNQKELEDIVAEKLPELTPDQFTFKTLPNWAKQTLAKEIDIPVKKFEGSSNFTQAELNRVISFIENNIDTVRKALPDAAVLEGAPVSEGLIGTATGVPNNLLKDTNLYTRLERGTKKAGLVPFQKNKGIDNRSVLKAIGVIEGTRTAGPRDKQAQTAKGIINVLAKFITNQEIRKQADLTPQQKTDIETGKGSRLLYSFNTKGDGTWVPDLTNPLTGNKFYNFNVANQTFRISLFENDDFDYEILELTEGIKDDAFVNDSKSMAMAFFDELGSAEITGKVGAKDSIKVFSIVANSVLDIIKQDNLNSITFTGKEPSRRRLYESMVQKFQKELGWESYNFELEGETVFVVYNPKIFKSEETAPSDAKESRILFSISSEDKSLLDKYKIPNYEIKNINDADRWINDVKKLIKIFNTEDYKLINLSTVLFNERAINNDKVYSYLEEKLIELKNQGLLPSRVTIGRSRPGQIFKNNPGSFENEINKIEPFNKKHKKVFNKMWQDIKTAIDQDKTLAGPIMYFLSIAQNERTHPMSLGAPVVAYQWNAKKFEYEHAMQQTYAYRRLLNSILSKSNFQKELNYVNNNYFVIALGKINDNKLREAGYANKFEDSWTNWWQRYFNPKVAAINGGIDPNDIFFIGEDGKTLIPLGQLLGINADGSKSEAQINLSKSIKKAEVKNNLELPKSQRLPKGSTNEQVLAKMQELDNEANEARIKYSKSQNLDEAFNDIIEAKTGIETYKRFSPAKATVRGASKGKFNFFIPPSAEDFTGLLYKTLAKGKLGDRQMQWYKDNLLDPYARAMNDISAARVAMFEDYKALKEDLEIIPKDLKKKSVDEYTREQAVRVYIWNSQDNNIPGLFKTDQKELVDYVNNDPELRLFAEQLIAIQKNDDYSAPKEGWLTGSITTDLLDNVNSIKRKKYLEQWQNNVDEIFSEVNMNKLEAAFGKPYRKALENILTRMKTGRNKPFTSDSLAGRVTDWLNNSVGAIMFFNTRSAVLQTISSINFINWSDNNIYQAGKAFANQPQYWKDFKFLFNSDFLKERRGGLRFNVSESEIADAAEKGGARGVISKILQAGFLPTQVADSFAIASGGATFYRNRIKSYLKETDVDGNKIYTEAEAQEKAFLDFREIAEESQQSSRPDRISAQQAGPLGRTILAFANTPAQYARLTKKAASDLINGRGDAKTNISKLLYYGAVQNLIFNVLQQAAFAIAFGDSEEDEKEKEEKYISVANGMADGLLRGIGLGGAVISTLKNALIKIIKESEKKRPDYAETTVIQLLGISPPIQSKAQKIRSALKSYEWNKKEMLEKGFSLDNPAYLAGANVISASTNVPLDRIVKKVDNVRAATRDDISKLERMMLLAGWSDWQLGIQKPKEVKPKKKKKPKFKRVRKGDR